MDPGRRMGTLIRRVGRQRCRSSGLIRGLVGQIAQELITISPSHSFLDIVFSIEVNIFQSMTKVRSLGYTGYIDTEESFYAIFDRMARDGVFPKGLPGREAGRKAFRY